ncbi:MAG: Dabb family protein [Desulfobacterales bacterium]|nr:Dabb family protein [Desulfobacterales bacterium]
MLKHIVLLRLKNDAKGATASENALKLKEMLEALPPKIAEIKSFEIGLNIFPGSQASHICLYSEFDDEAALNRYATHPEHQRVVAFIQQVMEERRVVDYFT